MSFQNWHDKFDKFWPKHREVSKICTLIGSICTKYITFDLKKEQRSYLPWHWRVMQNLKKTDLWFGKWDEEFRKFSPEYSKVSKLGLWWDPFIQSRKCMSFRFTEGTPFVTIKNDAKWEEELACRFKIDMRNVRNSDPSTWKSQKFAL